MTATLDGCLHCEGDGGECPWCSVPEDCYDIEEIPYPLRSPWANPIMELVEDDPGLLCTDERCDCDTARLCAPDAPSAWVMISGAFRWTPDMPVVRFGAS
jgi:hypothetical protein